jgi:hypothetical protein
VLNGINSFGLNRCIGLKTNDYISVPGPKGHGVFNGSEYVGLDRCIGVNTNDSVGRQGSKGQASKGQDVLNNSHYVVSQCLNARAGTKGPVQLEFCSHRGSDRFVIRRAEGNNLSESF